jgi:hypothetical protein
LCSVPIAGRALPAGHVEIDANGRYKSLSTQEFENPDTPAGCHLDDVPEAMAGGGQLLNLVVVLICAHSISVSLGTTSTARSTSLNRLTSGFNMLPKRTTLLYSGSTGHH